MEDEGSRARKGGSRGETEKYDRVWSTGKRPREDDTEDRGGRRKKNREEEQQHFHWKGRKIDS